ncbi:hypothetical protein TrVFT333_008099 [Trichoderma virens FT-333]|nr:hypothetical protein TrVFT333_008099 [Trichoderma virens FT-333]
MNIVSRSPKTWPYAQSQGEARRLFESDLKKTILEYLIEHSDKAQESGSYLSIPLFMVGKRAKRAKPVVMFVSDDKVARKEAYDLIIKSDIMTKYPGFELGHSDFEKLMAWADETVFAFTAQREDASDCCQLAYRPSSDSEKPLRLATAGGVVSYGRRHMLLTVSHFLKDPPTIELPVHIAEANQISDCEITGLGDFDDDDDDDTDTEFVETVRQGSISDVDESKESEIGDSDTPISASESDGNSQRRSPSLHKNPFYRKGVDIISPSAALFNNAISLTDLDKVESGPRKTDVKAMTSNGDTVRGVMSEDTLTVRLPQFTEFVEVYTARFFGSLGPGDCGSWVRDEVTGRLFGHVFAGNLPNGLTAIMPAKLVFEHARTQLDQQFPLVESLESDQELENLVLQSVEDDHDSTYGSAKPSMTKISQHLPNIIPGIFGPGNDKEPTQSKPIKKYVCRDPATAGLYSELKPDYPLSRCRACSSKKKYGAYYNAAAHLRRIHFRQRRPLGISGHMNKSRGKTNGNWPLMSQLRLWFEEVEADESPGSIDADNDTPVEDFLSTNEYLPDSNTDPSAPSFHPLKDRILSNSSKETVGLLAPLPQSLNTSPLGFSFSPNSLSTMTPSSSSDSPYQLINVNSNVSPSQSWDIDFLYFLNETGALSTFITEVSSLAPSSLVKADMKGPSTSTIAKSPVTASTPGALPEVSDDDFALYNNQHINPQYSYTQLITQAILNAPNGELDIDGIFTFIKNSHPYYRLLHEADGWQNFVRLRLQLDNSFEEVAGSTKEPMKEMKWHIVPERRGN